MSTNELEIDEEWLKTQLRNSDGGDVFWDTFNAFEIHVEPEKLNDEHRTWRVVVSGGNGRLDIYMHARQQLLDLISGIGGR